MRIASGIFREEGQHSVALQNAVGDGAVPHVAELDLVLVEPDILSALFQVGLDAAGQTLLLSWPKLKKVRSGTTEASGKTWPQSSQTQALRFVLKTTFSDEHLGQRRDRLMASPWSGFLRWVLSDH